MQAIILAAGLGRRLGEYTSNNTKCMLEVNGKRLIDRMLVQLSRLKLSRIVIVIGYKGDNLRRYIEENHSELSIRFVENPVYDKTNNIYSLWLARELMMEDDTLLLESDLIFEDKVAELAINSPYENCALVSKYETWNDGTMVRLNRDNDIVNFIPKKDFNYAETDTYYKTVNIYKFSRDFVVNHYMPFLEAYIKVLGENEYYEQVLRVITLIDSCGIKAQPVSGLRWYEIDDVQDLRIAETLFADPEERLVKLQHSYGGYWRYTGLIDFCYLVNPYFPQPRMIDEMVANFESLLCNYPSGMGVNSMLAGKYFGVKQDYIVVGNGAAELIKALMEHQGGKVGIAYPTFEEYPNRLKAEQVVAYTPSDSDFRYSVGELISWFSDKEISTLLLVNPDNPSGNFIPRKELFELCEWCGVRNIRLIIDESFVDFADDGNNQSMLHNELLDDYPTMCVVKSISKSYGVPGLRLGVLASADKELIANLKKQVSIWNINSFAEFYMQIFNKYEKDYVLSCEKFREERQIFRSELSSISGLRVIPSQANYFLCEIIKPISSAKLTLRLLSDYNILIKDCSAKSGFGGNRQFVRIAIRDRRDNQILTNALKEILS